MSETPREIELPDAKSPAATALTLGQAADRLGLTTDEVFDLVRRHGVPVRCTPRTGLVVDPAALALLETLSRSLA